MPDDEKNDVALVFRPLWPIQGATMTANVAIFPGGQPPQNPPLKNQAPPANPHGAVRRSDQSGSQHMRYGIYGAAIASFVFAIMLMVVIFGGTKLFSPSGLDHVWEWWPFICGAYVMCEVAPLISYNPLEETREKVDILTSPLVAAVLFLLVPAVFIAKGEWPVWWVWKIWLNSVPFSLIDLMLMLVLYRISRATVRTTTV